MLDKKIKKKKYLVTGGAGAIGSSLANYLAEDPSNRVDVIDNLDSGFLENIAKKKNLNVHIGSITDKDFLEKFKKEDFDYIFHLAACFANQNSIDRPLHDLNVNILGTVNMLEIAKDMPNLKKFSYTSSSCVYGASPKEYMSEADELNPETPYAVSKLSGEYYTRYYNLFYKVPTNIFRLFNIYGSNEYPGKYRNVIPNFVHLALNNKNLNVMGDGTDTRDFTFIEDALEMILNASYASENIGEIYNIGAGSETKIIDLANNIIKGINSNSKINFIPKRDWDKISKRKASVKKIAPFKDTEHKKLEHGLPKVFDFISSIQSYIDEK